MRPQSFPLFALLLIGGACHADKPAASIDVEKTIARTRETRATYSLYVWTVITRPGQPAVGEWAAEFHKGELHRVETPRDRVVANCAEMTGTYLSVETGKKFTGLQVARAACGIQANSAILSASVTGKIRTRFGVATNLRIVDKQNVRTYSVADNGALVGATISDLSGNLLLSNEAIALEGTAPTDIFAPDSLDRSVVPEKYKTR